MSKYVSCSKDLELEAIDDEVDSFVRRFGTYLQIHSCLVFSASVEAEKAVDALLEVAQYDPSHVDTLKEFQKVNDLTFYEAVRHIYTDTIDSLTPISYRCLSTLDAEQTFCVDTVASGCSTRDSRASAND